MSPTLYTARNNGKENNGGNTTMVGDKDNNDKQWNMVQRSLECVSEFPLMGRQGRDTEGVGFRGRQFTGDEHPRALLPLTHDFVIFHHFTSSSCAHLP